MQHQPIALPGGVYGITDRALAGGASHAAIVEAWARAGLRIAQVREKAAGAPGQALRDDLLQCVAIARRAGMVLIVNDDVDLACESGASGAHVGQQDLSASDARRRLGTKRVLGISTHSKEQFLEALELPVDYVAIGPLFPTTTKNAGPALGVEFARWASPLAARRGVALVGIGGIDRPRLAGLREAAAELRPAVISALFRGGAAAHGATLEARAREFSAAWDATRGPAQASDAMKPAV